MQIIDHNGREAKRLQKWLGKNRYNGAYYYSVEIGKFFIPKIRTRRNWVTVGTKQALDHSIVFVHETLSGPDCWRKYEHFFKCRDVVYVVSVRDDLEQFEPHGHAVYLPLSVDTKYVEKFKREKDRGTAFAGRDEWRQGIEFPDGIDYIGMVPREELLSEMARYRTVYAECRTAIEAKVLGCDVVKYHPLFAGEPFDVLDSRDAARMLQALLDEVDR